MKGWYIPVTAAEDCGWTGDQGVENTVDLGVKLQEEKSELSVTPDGLEAVPWAPCARLAAYKSSVSCPIKEST